MDQLKILRVLLVDDDSSIQMAMKYFFENKVREFKAVESAEAAAKSIIKEGPWDIIFCDYGLPGMDGMDFLRMVKQKWPELLTVMITAIDEEGIAEEAARIGVDEFIQKPFNPQLINECLLRLVQKLEST